jgi:hypothetical protein
MKCIYKEKYWYEFQFGYANFDSDKPLHRIDMKIYEKDAEIVDIGGMPAYKRKFYYTILSKDVPCPYGGCDNGITCKHIQYERKLTKWIDLNQFIKHVEQVEKL